MICQTERCKKHNIPLSTKNRERDAAITAQISSFCGKDFTVIYTSIKHLISFQLNERLITGPGVARCTLTLTNTVGSDFPLTKYMNASVI